MKKGFTIIEIILVIALLALFAGFSVQLTFSALKQNDMEMTRSMLISQIRSAQLNALEQVHDGDWGIHVAPGSLTLFRGTSYATRLSQYDEVVSVPTHIQFSGLSSIIFTTYTGLPTQTGTITMSSDAFQSQITLNSYGALTY